MSLPNLSRRLLVGKPNLLRQHHFHTMRPQVGLHSTRISNPLVKTPVTNGYLVPKNGKNIRHLCRVSDYEGIGLSDTMIMGGFLGGLLGFGSGLMTLIFDKHERSFSDIECYLSTFGFTFIGGFYGTFWFITVPTTMAVGLSKLFRD